VVKDSVKKTRLEAVVRWDAEAQDTVKDNENIIRWSSSVEWNDGSRFESAESEDADGDSLVTAKGPESKARVNIRVTDSGVVSRAELIAGPGPDADFDAEADNVMYLARWWAMKGPDTLHVAQYLDAGEDGDSLVVDNGKTSVVILDFREFNPSAKPGVAQGHVRIKTRNRFQEKEEVIGVSGEETLRNGRVNRFALADPAGNPTVDLQDTVLARFTTVGAPQDTLDSLQGEIKGFLGDLDDKADDRTYALSLTVANKRGEEIRGHIRFVSDVPMLPDTKPRDGNLTLRLDYDDNTSLLLDGTLEAGAMSATVTLRDGRRFSGRWDASGKLLEWKRD
jgi:hypothetical protein